VSLLQELAVTQHLHDQQQEALAALHAEEKATDRAFKRDFGHVDPLVLPHLAAMYKTRIRPVGNSTAGSGLAGQHSSTAAAAGAAAAAPVAQWSGRVGSASRGSVGPSPRGQRGGQPAASPRASKIGAAGQLASPGGRQGAGSQGAADSASASAELAFTPLNLKPGHRPGSAAPAPGAAAGASGSGAQQHGRAGGLTAAQQQELSGPLGLPEVEVVQLSEGQMPEGVDDDLWFRFVELHAARAQLDLVVREQTAKVGDGVWTNQHMAGCFLSDAACCVAM
jgi:hypothetical protein